MVSLGLNTDRLMVRAHLPRKKARVTSRSVGDGGFQYNTHLPQEGGNEIREWKSDYSLDSSRVGRSIHMGRDSHGSRLCLDSHSLPQPSGLFEGQGKALTLTWRVS